MIRSGVLKDNQGNFLVPYIFGFEQNWSAVQHFNAGFTALNGNFKFGDTTNIGMEIGRQDGTPGNPYIDFHTDGKSSTDFNVRLFATANKLTIYASDGVELTGNLTGKYLTGTWLQGTASNHSSSAASKICIQDPSGWVYHRTPSEILSDIGAVSVDDANSLSMVPYGGQATTLSALGTGGVYSISANGYLRIAYQTTAADNFITMKQVNSSGADMWGFLANGQKTYGSGYPYIYMPVAAGDHIKVDFGSSVRIIQVQLIKVKGV